MTNEAVGLTVDIGGDTGDAQNALTSLGGSLDNLETIVDSLVSHLDALDQSLNGLGNAGGSGSGLSGVTDQLDAVAASTDDVGAATAANTDETKLANDESSNFGSTLANLTQIMQGVSGEMAHVIEGLSRTAEQAAEAGGGGGLGGILKVGTAAVALFGLLGEAGGAYATQLSRLADTTGMSIEATEKLSIAMADVGGNQTSLLRGASSLTAVMTQTAQALDSGGELSAKSSILVNKLGISIRETSGEMRTGGEVFEETLAKLGGMANKTEAVGLAMQLFGTRMGGQLIPLIKNYSTVMASAEQQQQIMGTSTEDLGAKALEFNKAQETLTLEFHHLALEVLPAFTGALKLAEVGIQGVTAVLAPAIEGLKSLTQQLTNPGVESAIFGATLMMIPTPLTMIAGAAILTSAGVHALNNALEDGTKDADNYFTRMAAGAKAFGDLTVVTKAYNDAVEARKNVKNGSLGAEALDESIAKLVKQKAALEAQATAMAPTPAQNWAKAITDGTKAADALNSKLKDVTDMMGKFKQVPTAETVGLDVAINKVSADIANYKVVLNAAGVAEDDHSKQLDANKRGLEAQREALIANRQVMLDEKSARMILDLAASGQLTTEQGLAKATENATQKTAENTTKIIEQAKAAVLLTAELRRIEDIKAGISDVNVKINFETYLKDHDVQAVWDAMQGANKKLADSFTPVIEKEKDLAKEEAYRDQILSSLSDGVMTLNEVNELAATALKSKLTPAQVDAARSAALYAVSLQHTKEEINAAMSAGNVNMMAHLTVDSALRDSMMNVANAELQAKVNAQALAVALQEGGGALQAYTAKLAQTSVAASNTAFNDLMSQPSVEQAGMSLASDKFQLEIDRMAMSITPAIDGLKDFKDSLNPARDRINDFKDAISASKDALADQRQSISDAIDKIGEQMQEAAERHKQAMAQWEKDQVNERGHRRRTPTPQPGDGETKSLEAEKQKLEKQNKALDKEEKALTKKDKALDQELKNIDKADKLADKQITALEKQTQGYERAQKAIDQQMKVSTDTDKILKDDYTLANNMLKTDKERERIAGTLTKNLDDATGYLHDLNLKVPDATGNIVNAGVAAKNLGDALEAIHKQLPASAGGGGGNTPSPFTDSQDNTPPQNVR